MKKLFCLLLTLALTLSLAACGAAPAETPPAEGAAPFKIGILQLTSHAALDGACNGFLAGLKDAGLVEGSDYSIDLQNANGDLTVCSTIATKFVTDGVDLILAIATPAAQAAAQATSEIPILVTAVTDPAASGLMESNDAPGRNVSGTSDMNPVADQVALLKKLVPDAKNVGILYSSGEDNSTVQVALARTELEKLGMTVSDFTAADSSEVQSVTQSASTRVDAMYIPTDNLMADTIGAISSILTAAGVPIICGEEAVVTGGATATLGISYEQLGRQTAAMAVEILKDGADISKMPVQFFNGELTLAINEDAVKTLGLSVPADLK